MELDGSNYGHKRKVKCEDGKDESNIIFSRFNNGVSFDRMLS